MNKHLLKVCTALLAASMLLTSCGDDADVTTTQGSTSDTTTASTTTSETTTETTETTTETTTTEETTTEAIDPDKVYPFSAVLGYTHHGNGVVKFDLVVSGKQKAADVMIDTGDGFISYGNLAYYAYPKTGTYRVNYTVTGDKGSVITDAIDVVVEEKVTLEAKPIISPEIAVPVGGGNKDINVIMDGIIPSVGTNDANTQFDSYTKEYIDKAVYVGMEFTKSYPIKGINFTEGRHFSDGGWFKNTPVIEVLVNGEWVEKEATISMPYPETNDQYDHGKSFETYSFTFAEEITCDGIRLSGVPGGISTFISVAEVEAISDSVTTVEKEYTDNEVVLITCDVVTPTGSGARDIRIIADGEVGEGQASLKQYDTYHGLAGRVPTYIGYLYKEEKTVNSLVLTEGMHFEQGGWFEEEIRVEALIDGEWVSVEYTISPEYPKSDLAASISAGWEVYTFTLKEAVVCEGIRLAGTCGGSSGFISVAELTVK